MDQLDGLADQFARGGIIGDLQPFFPNFAQSVTDDFCLKRLRSLHSPQLRAVKVATHKFSVGGRLDGVRNQLCGDRCPVFARCDNGRFDQCKAAYKAGRHPG